MKRRDFVALAAATLGQTGAGEGLRHYQMEPFLDDDRLVWREGPAVSLNPDIPKFSVGVLQT